MKIPNSFSNTIFNRHRIQYESGALSETDFSNFFFFLLTTTDRIKSINRYLASVNLNPINIDLSEFGPNFDTSRRNCAGPHKEDTRKSVLKVFEKVADLSNQNVKRNANGLLAKQVHNNDSLLWPGSKRVRTDKFALSY